MTVSLPHILSRNIPLLTPLPHRPPLLIPTQRLPHIQRILAIIIIILHPAIHSISHLPIQLLCNFITRAHKQVDEPRIRRVAGALQGGGERGRVAESTGAGRDGEGGDVAVPGEVVWVFDAGGGGRIGRDWGVVGGGFEFA
jgi:hypothetical protein